MRQMMVGVVEDGTGSAAAIASLTVLGALQAPPAIRAALKDRIT